MTKTPSANAITASVLVVWCTITLSMMTWLHSGVASAMSWITSEATSTSRQMPRWRASSAMNQRKPNARAGPTASSSAARAASLSTSSEMSGVRGVELRER